MLQRAPTSEKFGKPVPNSIPTIVRLFKSVVTNSMGIQKPFLEANAGNKVVEDFVKYVQREAELYSKYKQYYGYVFYIGKK